jgi:hypothetical protein
MATTVKIWVDETEPAPSGFDCTDEKVWCGASWVYAHVGQVPESEIKEAAYGECFYANGEGWPIERIVPLDLLSSPVNVARLKEAIHRSYEHSVAPKSVDQLFDSL